MYNKLIIILIIILLIYFNYKNTETFTTLEVNKNIVVSHLIGGLANRIYMILAGITFAKIINKDYYFLDSEIKDEQYNDGEYYDRKKMINELKTLFPSVNFLENSVNTSDWYRIDEKNIDYNTKINSNIILSGYFQNESVYFLNPKIELNEPSVNILKNVDKTNLYFIHFRFGDYVGHPDFDLNLVNYYKKCIKNIKDKNIYATFFVITNDTNTANNYIKTNQLLNADEIIYDTSTNRLDTLYYITQCKGGICANSSFSRIGAYFIKNKNKENIYYPNDKRDTTNMNWLTIVEI